MAPEVCLPQHWSVTIPRSLSHNVLSGEYPASSTSASEAANEHALKRRGPIFIMVTNFPLSFGGPLAVIIFLIVLSAATTDHLSTIWRVCFGIGCLFPLAVFYFRIRMLNSKLYRRGAIKRRVPYPLVMRYYWKSLIGTCGAWFIYDFVLAHSRRQTSALLTMAGCFPKWCLFREDHLHRRI